MKRFFQYIGIILLTVVMASCGSSGGGGSSSGSSGTSTVSISVGNVSGAGAEMVSVPSASGVQDIPQSVNSILFSVTFGDGANEQRCVRVLNPDNSRKAGIVETFTGANGTWNISVLAYSESDCNGTIEYTGSSTQSVSGSITITVQMYNVNPCDLYVAVDDPSAFDDGNNCRNSQTPCLSITNALRSTDGDETICVAEGDYRATDPNDCCETFPLRLKPGTTILCEGVNHLAQIYVEPGRTGFKGSFQGEGTILADGASIVGCRINLLPPQFAQDFPTIGIDDTGASITVDNVMVKGDESNNSIGIFVQGDSTINNSELTCSAVDLAINNGRNMPANVQNNSWDNPQPETSDPDQGCLFDGTDICIFDGVIPDFSGATQAADGCPRCIPTNEIDTTCDGIDDDCDGTKDEDFVPTFTQAECGVGLCKQLETLECIGGAITPVCVPLDPVAEGFVEGPVGDFTCDDLEDNDCDDLIDADDPDCQEVCVPFLLTPSFEASLENPDLDTCPVGDTRDWSFSWTGCPGDTSYELEIYEPGAFPATASFVHATSTTSFIHSTSTPSFIPTDMLTGWIWRVKSIISGAFSETRPFNVDPPTDCIN